MTVRVEFFFTVPERPDLDFGRELAEAAHEALGGDQALHALAAEHGAQFSGRSWESL